MARNNVDVSFAYEHCCGMPLWHNGDMEGAIELARKNVANLLRFINDGRTIVATTPTCSEMIRIELSIPRLLGTDDAKKIIVKTSDRWSFLCAGRPREN